MACTSTCDMPMGPRPRACGSRPGGVQLAGAQAGPAGPAGRPPPPGCRSSRAQFVTLRNEVAQFVGVTGPARVAQACLQATVACAYVGLGVAQTVVGWGWGGVGVGARRPQASSRP